MRNRFILSMLCMAICFQAQNVSVSIAKYRDDKSCAISYTYDDGLREHYTLIAPIMEQYGFRGTFWICGHNINKDEQSLKDTTRLSWQAMKIMSDNGHEISNHGWSHRNLVRITPEEAKTEVEKNDSAIFANLHFRPKTYCYAFNAKNDRVVDMASKNRVGTRLKQFSMGGKSTHENLEKRIDDLIETQEWGIAMIHGITYGYDAFKDANILFEHFKKVKAIENKIWIGTFAQVSAYIEERNQTTFDILKKGNRLTITPKCMLDKTLFTEPLTMVLEIEKAKRITVHQGKKRIEPKIQFDQVIFDFDPFGQSIQVSYKQ